MMGVVGINSMGQIGDFGASEASPQGDGGGGVAVVT